MLFVHTTVWHEFAGGGRQLDALVQQPGIAVCAHWPVTGSQLSKVQMLLSLQLLSGPDVQTPAWQVSPTVQGLPSSQAAPFGLFAKPQTPFVQVACWHWLVGCGQSLALRQQPGISVCSHVPLLGLQVSVVQMSLSSQSLGPPGTQTPAWQVSPTVQGLPSSQAAPFGLFAKPQTPFVQVACWHWSVDGGQSVALVQQPAIGVCTHWPVSGLQVSTVQGLLSSQSLGPPGTQTPAWQVSPTVQGLPSSQAAPFCLLPTPQVLFARQARWEEWGDGIEWRARVQQHD